jgi:hypothetical protein
MSKLAKLLVAANLVIWGVVGVEVAQAEEVKKEKACVEVKDAKTGKVTQQCKEIKKHKKLEVEKK